MTDPKFIMIDLFCGCGGASLGAQLSGVCKVIVAINHDRVAIRSHSLNHKDVHHFVEDVRKVNLNNLKYIVDKARRKYPQAKVILWASPDCTNHSNAKGGLPRDPDSRTLPEVLPTYVRALKNIDFVMIENVREFLAWGPLDEKGKPIDRKNGQDYLRWVKQFEYMGYKWDYKLLNVADYGTPQSRVRLFGAFHKLDKMPFPQATHVRRKKSTPMFQDEREGWRPVLDVLDMHDLGKSIFGRKKPLVDRTLDRIIRGLEKYKNEILLMTCNTPGFCKPVGEPSTTVTTVGHKALVIPMIATNYSPGTIKAAQDNPSQTVTADSNLHLVVPFIKSYYGSGNSFNDLSQSAPTLTTNDRLAMVSAFIDRQFGNGQPQSIFAPSGALTTTPKSNLCTAFLVNPQYSNKGNSVLLPSPTVIASQNGRPLSLAVATYASSEIKDLPSDSEVMLKLKALMREIGVVDIYFRMLKEGELKKIQGFPDEYILAGTSKLKKKHIGNAVPPHVVNAWLRAMANSKKTEQC